MTEYNQKENKNKFATLFVDASFHLETGAAGYGAWIIADGWGKGFSFGGQINFLLLSSHEAELCGIANSVARIKNLLIEQNITGILVQSDCLRALEIIRYNVKKAVVRNFIKGQKGAVVSSIYGRRGLSVLEKSAIKFLNKTGFIFNVRHVRGHNKGTNRESLNNLCDRIAKTHMKERRNLIRAAQ